MYRVICITKNRRYDLLNYNDEDYIIYNDKLTLEINKAGNFEFTMLSEHPNYNVIFPMVSIVKIYQDQDWIFTGRVTDCNKDFYKCKLIYCEGVFSYLCDSIVRPYTWNGATREYIMKRINDHNAAVEEQKRFEIGVLLSEESQLQIECKNYPSTMEDMQNNLNAEKGLHMEVEEKKDGRLYLNCTKEILHENSQEICFGENIIDLDERINGTTVKTVMIGIGGVNKAGNQITAVVENAEAIQEFGRIEGKKEFPDIVNREELTRLTGEYLKSILEMSRTIEVQAIDLNMVNSDIEKLRLGYVHVRSEPHGIQSKMILSKIVKRLTDPSDDIFTLGRTEKFFTEQIEESIRKEAGKDVSNTEMQIMTREELESIMV